MIESHQRSFHSRRGVVLVLALACLLVAGLVAATMMRTVAASHRQMQRSDDQNQSVWLAESGLQRACWKLANDPGYEGETWSIPSTEFEGRSSATVLIKVSPADADPTIRHIDIQSRYPDHVSRSILHRLKLEMKLPSNGDDL